MTDQRIFNIHLNNIPLLNIREEFTTYRELISEKEFIRSFENSSEPVETPFYTWHGEHEALISNIVQRIIMGIEAYIPGAALVECIALDELTKEKIKSFKNPYSGNTKRLKTVEIYYHLIPSYVNPEFSLKKHDLKLWEKTIRFYKEIRNPLFHGSEIQNNKIEVIKNIFNYFSEIYSWIDQWHSINNILVAINKAAKENNY